MKLHAQVRIVLRLKQYSYRTEQCYIAWITRFIRHDGLRHLNTMGQIFNHLPDGCLNDILMSM